MTIDATAGSGTAPGQPEGTPDTRWDTRRAKQRALKRRLQEQRERRIHNEGLVLSAAASGASWRAIAQQTGFSETHVRRLYTSAMARPGDVDVVAFKKVQSDRLNRLLFATWADAMDNDPKAVRNALQIVQELSKMEPGLYPSERIDLSGTLAVKDASLERVAAVLSHLQNQAARRRDLAIEATAVDALDEPHRLRQPALNGHDGHSFLDAPEVEGNGSAPEL